MRSLLYPIILWLRGDYNSVRHRFINLPKIAIKQFFHTKILRKSWIDFYGNYLDESVQKSGGTEKKPKQKYLDDAVRYFEYLKSEGLRPNDKFLDYGCGILRLGLPMIPFLEPGNYVGIEISSERLAKGRYIVTEAGIAESDYRLHCVSDCELKEVAGQRFKYIWAKSVLTHMPLEDVKVLLSSISNVLLDDGYFYFTFNVGEEEYSVRNFKDMYFSLDYMRELCEASGLKYELMSNWSVELEGDYLARVKKS